jgi:hypothetical protein
MMKQSKGKLQTASPNHKAGQSANGPHLGHSGGTKTVAPPVYCPKPLISQAMQPKMARAPKTSALPPAPPVYHPGPVVNAVQPKNIQRASPVLQPTRGTPTTPPAHVQMNASTVQAKGNKCIVCGHRHGSSRCTVVTARDAKGKAASWCGCRSHSSKWDSGSRVNPGSGRRARILAAH